MFENISSKMGNNPILFGIGGIGDFFLLMSDGNYDKYDELSLVFWANNPVTIKYLLPFFPKIKFHIITTNYLNSEHKYKYYNEILLDENFLTKSHIPDNLNYINEWYGADPFKKYGIKRTPQWALDMKQKNISNDKSIIICPTGGSSDTGWKHKYMKKETLDRIFKFIKSETKVYVISTEKEVNMYGNYFDGMNVNLLLDYSFGDLFKIISNSSLIYSVDTWVKTLSCFMNIPTVLVESFYSSNPYDAIGLDIDPGDFIFIKNWNFVDIIKQ